MADITTEVKERLKKQAPGIYDQDIISALKIKCIERVHREPQARATEVMEKIDKELGEVPDAPIKDMQIKYCLKEQTFVKRFAPNGTELPSRKPHSITYTLGFHEAKNDAYFDFRIDDEKENGLSWSCWWEGRHIYFWENDVFANIFLETYQKAIEYFINQL